MDYINVNILEDGKCSIVHNLSGSSIVSGRPKVYGGTGEHFSATDLLAASLGACIGSSISRFLVRNDLNLDSMNITVRKELLLKPKKLKSLKVEINLLQSLDKNLSLRILKIAKTCIVHKSLSKEIEVQIILKTNNAQKH